MCEIFAGQDPATYAHISRSVRLGGHATSIRLEASFWDILDEIAARQSLTTPRFLSTLYDEVLELHGHISNFTSLLRVACVLYLRRPELMAHLPRAMMETSAAE
jgi:predicted DNA-binding ribbon-helix-helix protein